ncbi:MAG: hypothetical protein R2849_07980 [Thermomicrobiales bacterium]
MEYGVRSGYGDLKRVIMHRPGEELHKVTPGTLAEFNFDRPVDVEAFQTDYDAMLDIFHQHDVETLLLTEVLASDDDALGYIRHRPNMTYTRDLATVFKSGAVLMGPHLRGRWGDQAMLGRAFKKLGIPILGAIEQPDFLEGGGVIPIGEDTIAASICDRANENGTRALREIILGTDAQYFLDVPLPFGEIHIDGTFMVLDESSASSMSRPSRSSLPPLRGRQVRTPPHHVPGLPRRAWLHLHYLRRRRARRDVRQRHDHPPRQVRHRLRRRAPGQRRDRIPRHLDHDRLGRDAGPRQRRPALHDLSGAGGVVCSGWFVDYR